jgi:alkylation response protein AidB-like acyl-CoA dehydrogenase
MIEIISAADPSLGQIPQNHLGVVAAIRTVSEPQQQQELFAEVLKGVRFGNAFSEFKSKRAADFETTFVDKGDHVVVTGEKFYSTGALFAHLVPIVALDEQARAWYAIADRDAPGLIVLDDWSAFGQRATFSGTTLIDRVRVPKSHLVPGYKGYDRPTADGAIFQIIQAAVDTGIARNAIEDTIALVRGKARAWVDSSAARASDDPYTIHAVGDLVLHLHAAQALLEIAGRAVDRGRESDARIGRRSASCGRRSESVEHGDGDRGDQQAVRAGRHPLDARRAQPRPALAQCAHAHFARPGAMEVRHLGQLSPQWRQSTAPRLELVVALPIQPAQPAERLRSTTFSVRP